MSDWGTEPNILDVDGEPDERALLIAERDALAAKVATLEAAIRGYINGDDQRLGFNGLKAALAAETEAQPPSDWELAPSKPMHSISVNHRGRWVDGILKCWDCPAEWSPPKIKGNET